MYVHYFDKNNMDRIKFAIKKMKKKKKRKEKKNEMKKKEKNTEKLSKNSFIISTQSTRFYCTRNNSSYYRSTHSHPIYHASLNLRMINCYDML